VRLEKLGLLQNPVTFWGIEPRDIPAYSTVPRSTTKSFPQNINFIKILKLILIGQAQYPQALRIPYVVLESTRIIECCIYSGMKVCT
jgi:hypothetical protein